MNPTIHNLIFDLGGVLYDLDIEGCLQAFEQAGLTEVRHLITGTNEAGIFQAYETGELSTPRFREEVRRLIGNPQLTDEDIDRMWNRMLVHLPQEKLDLLHELGRHYRLYLLSNTNDLHWEHVVRQAFAKRGYQVSDFFQQVFLSFRMKLAKPNPAIFLTALENAGLKAEKPKKPCSSTIHRSTARQRNQSVYRLSIIHRAKTSAPYSLPSYENHHRYRPYRKFRTLRSHYRLFRRCTPWAPLPYQSGMQSGCGKGTAFCHRYLSGTSASGDADRLPASTAVLPAPEN